MTCEYSERLPTPDEHRELAEAVGWGHAFAWEAMPASLERSVCGTVATYDGQVVGMGRVVGDGSFYFYVQDVVVHPDHQGRGVGDALLGRLLAQVDRLAPPKAFVGLFAAATAGRLYGRHGFAERPGMTGMFRVVG